MTTAGGTAIAYDARQNITTGLGTTYGYDAVSQLKTAGSATLSYDPLGRLFETSGTTDSRFLYDGVQAVAEYDASGNLVRRHVPGPGLDGTVATYDGPGPSSSQFLLTDERGSVVAITDHLGSVSTLNRYDEYGVPATGNTGRFQYTGQMWVPEAGVYHYRARAYAPQIGRFLQTDPIGYAAGANLYGYVGADPVNFTDPWGLGPEDPGDTWICSPGMDCDVPTRFDDLTVYGGVCSIFVLCLDPDQLEYLDVGLSLEWIFVGGFEYERGYTYIIDTSGPFKTEIGRCSYWSFTGATGFGIGLGPTVQWDSGAPNTVERSMILEGSFAVFSGGLEVPAGGRAIDGTSSASSNPLDNYMSGTVRARPSVGLKFGGKTTRRFDCRTRGSY